MDHPSPEQHSQIRDALSAALMTKPLVAQEAFLKFPSATDEVDQQEQSTLRRFRSLSMSTKERSAWSEDTVKRKYPTDKTIELYQFSSDFETADLNQMLEPYQHHRCERGGYRIKWLNDTRALAVFRRAETAQRVLDDLGSSRLVKLRNYTFSADDLADFNKKYSDEPGSPSAATANASEAGSPHPGFDVEHIRYKYRPEVTIELHDFPCPLETTDLQKLFVGYKREDNIVRIKWFNRNRALAWFTNPQMASEALEDLRTCELVHVKPYMFEDADMRYFNPDNKMAEISSGTLARRRTISSGSTGSGGLARRNTVSGASHYHRGHMYAASVAHAAAYGAVPSIPSVLGAGAINGSMSQAGSTAASPMPPFPRRLRRFSKAED
ncbi:hypothetical protein LPJ53_000264 [Coemansia erecta]|uniref:Uncharacterized protein n=1 Tax=Coemansia erecta TaxID=147472 RepID=A0A9W7Y2B1_9FUNG|nr:hypothetical protein LPJ53_000264 [Coemansia erecta]